MNRDRKEIKRVTHSDDCECAFCWSIVKSHMKGRGYDAGDFYCFGREFRFTGEVNKKRFIRDDILTFSQDQWILTGAYNKPDGFIYRLKNKNNPNLIIYTDKKGLESAQKIGYVDRKNKVYCYDKSKKVIR